MSHSTTRFTTAVLAWAPYGNDPQSPEAYAPYSSMGTCPNGHGFQRVTATRLVNPADPTLAEQFQCGCFNPASFG